MTSPDPKITSVFPKPLVCIQGAERPPLIPYYTDNSCNIEKAKQGVRLAIDSYNRACATPDWKIKLPLIGKYFQPKVAISTAPFRMQPQKCDNLTNYNQTIPFILQNLDLLEVSHPFFDIVYRLNPDQIHDFRSAKIFLDVANKLAEEFSKKSIRSLKVTYPASGSHIAPLAIALQMMDRRIIDNASFIYTEIDENSFERIKAYLEGESDIFQNLTISDKIQKNPGYERVFRWNYKSKQGVKPIELTLAINRGGDYSRDEHLTAANLTIVHDRGQNPLSDRHFVKRVDWLRQKEKIDTPAWVLTESFPTPFTDYSNQVFAGYFACGNDEDKNIAIYTLKGQNLTEQNRSTTDPFKYSTHQSEPLTIHLNQKREGASLYFLPTFSEVQQLKVTEVATDNISDHLKTLKPDQFALIGFVDGVNPNSMQYKTTFQRLVKGSSQPFSFLMNAEFSYQSDIEKYTFGDYPTVGFINRSGFFIEAEDLQNPFSSLRLTHLAPEVLLDFYATKLNSSNNSERLFGFEGVLRLGQLNPRMIDLFLRQLNTLEASNRRWTLAMRMLGRSIHKAKYEKNSSFSQSNISKMEETLKRISGANPNMISEWQRLLAECPIEDLETAEFISLIKLAQRPPKKGSKSYTTEVHIQQDADETSFKYTNDGERKKRIITELKKKLQFLHKASETEIILKALYRLSSDCSDDYTSLWRKLTGHKNQAIQAYAKSVLKTMVSDSSRTKL